MFTLSVLLRSPLCWRVWLLGLGYPGSWVWPSFPAVLPFWGEQRTGVSRIKKSSSFIFDWRVSHLPWPGDFRLDDHSLFLCSSSSLLFWDVCISHNGFVFLSEAACLEGCVSLLRFSIWKHFGGAAVISTERFGSCWTSLKKDKKFLLKCPL